MGTQHQVFNTPIEADCGVDGEHDETCSVENAVGRHEVAGIGHLVGYWQHLEQRLSRQTGPCILRLTAHTPSNAKMQTP